jgi:hypothetical protein
MSTSWNVSVYFFLYFTCSQSRWENFLDLIGAFYSLPKKKVRALKSTNYLCSCYNSVWICSILLCSYHHFKLRVLLSHPVTNLVSDMCLCLHFFEWFDVLSMLLFHGVLADIWFPSQFGPVFVDQKGGDLEPSPVWGLKNLSWQAWLQAIPIPWGRISCILPQLS